MVIQKSTPKIRVFYNENKAVEMVVETSLQGMF